MKLLKYPYFSEVRGNDLNANSNITSALKRVVMAWATPITVNAELSSSQQVVSLLKSSPRAWLSNNTNVVPRIRQDGTSSFETPLLTKQFGLGTSIQGRFDSWFTGKESPLTNSTNIVSFSSVIERSPESAKIILFPSSDFLKDRVMQLIGSANRTDFRDNITLLKNAVDVSLEGEGLQDIRARSNFNRTLPPTEVSKQQWIEYGNYIIALILLSLIALGRTIVYKRRQKSYITAVRA